MWKTLKAFGFIYYEVYVHGNGFTPIWITRQNLASRYVVFYCDGKTLINETRGSMKNARALAATIIASLNDPSST